LSIKEINEKKSYFKKREISRKQIIELFDEINIMLQAGLTFQETIDILLDKYSINNQEYHILDAIISSLKQGIPIYIGLEKYKYTLGDLVLSFIKLGEQNSNMKDAINSLCIILIKENYNKKQILKKLSYPLLLLCTLIIAITIILIFVIPKIEYMFRQLDAS
jgi:type II secretory pathway component PulF